MKESKSFSAVFNLFYQTYFQSSDKGDVRGMHINENHDGKIRDKCRHTYEKPDWLF